MTLLFYFLAAVLIYLSYKSFRGGISYLNYFKEELAQPIPDYSPTVTIFAPCRGVDNGLLENLDALLRQDYDEFEVVFIVDEQNDPATKVIEEAWREGRRQVKLVVAPKATDSSQKVTNLREGIQYADPSSQVFVFVDSDARPSKDWLKNLVAPLKDENVGATTGYRWFISQLPTFASEMRNIWNASIASALGPDRKTNFCWGGSTAIRRDVFERLEIRQRWQGTLSDDFALTRAINEAHLDIYFVPRALIPSIDNCAWEELFEFTTRQMKITRVYMPKLWIASFLGSGLFNVVMLSSFLIMIFSPTNNLTVVIAMFTLLSVTIFSIGKSWLRFRAVELILGQYRRELRRQSLPQMTLWALSPAIFLYNCSAALISRKVAWRGTVYEMISPSETRIVRQNRG